MTATSPAVDDPEPPEEPRDLIAEIRYALDRLTQLLDHNPDALDGVLDDLDEAWDLVIPAAEHAEQAAGERAEDEAWDRNATHAAA